MESEIEYTEDEGGVATAETKDQTVWDNDMTFALIKEYKVLPETGPSDDWTAKDIWERISRRMHEKGHTVSAKECHQRWKTLELSFKIRSRQAKESEWLYYDLLKDIFKITPTKRLSKRQLSQIKRLKKSSKNYCQVETLEGEDVHPSNFLPSSESDEDCAEEVEERKETVEKSNGETPPKWFETFITHYQREEEEKRKTKERMHKERLAIETKKCVLLEKLIMTISKPAASPKIVNTVSVSQEMFESNFK